MPRRKRDPREAEAKAKASELKIKEFAWPDNNVMRNVTMSHYSQGVVLGEGPTPPQEELPADFVIHGPQGPLVIDAESNSPTMITGGGSIDELQGRLVHRPAKRKVFGYQRGGKSRMCECGREFYVFSTVCSSCGRKLKK